MAGSGSPESTWFWDHYDEAAGQVVDFLGEAGVELAGRSVADVGCGDGILDLGLAHRARPARLVGFDVNLTDVDLLRRRAEAEGVPPPPPELEFVRSETTEIPAEDHSFDVVVTWSAFEHVRDPVTLLREMRRIMARDGCLFLQLWPFYHSDRGSHLWKWFPASHHHLLQTEDEIVGAIRADPQGDPAWAEYMIDEFRHLNGIDVDDLQRSLLTAGLTIARFELMTHTVTMRPELMRFPVSRLAIAGVKLVAIPAG